MELSKTGVVQSWILEWCHHLQFRSRSNCANVKNQGFMHLSLPAELRKRNELHKQSTYKYLANHCITYTTFDWVLQSKHVSISVATFNNCHYRWSFLAMLNHHHPSLVVLDLRVLLESQHDWQWDSGALLRNGCFNSLDPWQYRLWGGDTGDWW